MVMVECAWAKNIDTCPTNSCNKLHQHIIFLHIYINSANSCLALDAGIRTRKQPAIKSLSR